MSNDEPKMSMPRANFPSGYELLQIGYRNVKPVTFTVLDSEKLNVTVWLWVCLVKSPMTPSEKAISIIILMFLSANIDIYPFLVKSNDY